MGIESILRDFRELNKEMADVHNYTHVYLLIVGAAFALYKVAKKYKINTNYPFLKTTDESGIHGELRYLHMNAHLMDDNGETLKIISNEESKVVKYGKALAKIPRYLSGEIRWFISGNRPNFVRVYSPLNDEPPRIEFVLDERTIRKETSIHPDKLQALYNDIQRLRLSGYLIGMI